MFTKNLQHRNSYLRLSCKESKPDLINDGMNQILLRHLSIPAVRKQELIVGDCWEIKEYDSRGYGEDGFTKMIEDLSIDDLDVIERSLIHLKNELINASKIPSALKLGIAERLYAILTQIKSFVKPIIVPYALQILNCIALDFHGAFNIAKNEALVKLIFNLLRSYGDFTSMCSEILLTLSSNIIVADEILKNDKFIDELEFQLYHPQNDRKFMEAMANFMSRQPKLFMKPQIIKSLLSTTNSCHPASYKCLSMIFNDSEADELAEKSNIANTLLTILLKTRDDEEVKTNIVMALRSCVINKKTFCQGFPWRLLLKMLIDGVYTKTNELLQLNCIELLRIMSDVDTFKDEMRKVYKAKIKDIHCLNADIDAMKDDLMQWLQYKNYKKNEGNKYAKLFI